MQQQISVITLGVDDLLRAKHFYGQGFGWTPVFEAEEIVFFQMNGLMLGLWAKRALLEDMRRTSPTPGAMTLAHNVGSREEVSPLMARLVLAGGTLLRSADSPPHGGFRGYVADPDGHAWKIAYNPAWTIDADGHVAFGI